MLLYPANTTTAATYPLAEPSSSRLPVVKTSPSSPKPLKDVVEA